MDFALNDEQLEFKAPCREFARDVIRPVAAKHDAEESTPWEVLQQAREQGLHGHRAPPAHGLGSRRGAGRHLLRGDALGLRRDRPRDLRLVARRRRPRRLRHPRADRPVGPRMLRDRRRDQVGRLRGDRGPGRLGRKEPEHHREARRRRVGAERDQGLHHERRDRRRSRRRRHRRPRAWPPWPGLLRGRQGHARPAPGQEGDEDRDPRFAHRRGRPRGLPHPGREPARRHGQARTESSSARARASRPAGPPTPSPPSS